MHKQLEFIRYRMFNFGTTYYWNSTVKQINLTRVG